MIKKLSKYANVNSIATTLQPLFLGLYYKTLKKEISTLGSFKNMAIVLI